MLRRFLDTENQAVTEAAKSGPDDTDAPPLLLAVGDVFETAGTLDTTLVRVESALDSAADGQRLCAWIDVDPTVLL